MATYSSHRLIMGKVELTVSAVSLEIFDFFFLTDMFIEKSSMFMMLHTTFVQIA